MYKALVTLAVGLAASMAPLTPAPAGESPTVIGVSIPGSEAAFHDKIRREAEQSAAAMGIQTAVEDAQWDPGSQSAAVNRFVKQKVHGILIDNYGHSLLDLPIEVAVKAGIPVATVGDVKPDSDGLLVHVGDDNVQLGRDAARLVIDRLGNKGSVIELEGGWPSAESRKAGFEEVIKKSKVRLLLSGSANPPAWSDTYSVHAAGDRQAARHDMADLIGRHHFEAVFAPNDEMIIGAIEALAEASINPGTKVTVGVGASPDALRYLRDGRLTATFDLLPGKQVEPALQYLVACIKGKTHPPRKVIFIKPRLVTKATLPPG